MDLRRTACEKILLRSPSNKRMKFVRCAHPTRNREAPLLAAYAERCGALAVKNEARRYEEAAHLSPRRSKPVERSDRRVARQPRLSHDLLNRATLSFQNPNLHRLLLGQHLDGSKSRHPRPGGSLLLRRGVGHFYVGVNIVAGAIELIVVAGAGGSQRAGPNPAIPPNPGSPAGLFGTPCKRRFFLSRQTVSCEGPLALLGGIHRRALVPAWCLRWGISGELNECSSVSKLLFLELMLAGAEGFEPPNGGIKTRSED